MTCNACLHFKMDVEPAHHLLGKRTVFCYLHRCEFDRAQTNADRQACGRYADRYKQETEEARKRYGFDKPVVPTDGAKQDELL